jgi:hypothetical protein
LSGTRVIHINCRFINTFNNYFQFCTWLVFWRSRFYWRRQNLIVSSLKTSIQSNLDRWKSFPHRDVPTGILSAKLMARYISSCIFLNITDSLPNVGLGKNPEIDSNWIIWTEKWLNGRVGADRRVVSRTFLVVDGL